MKYIAAFLMMMFAGGAAAEILSWSPPTTREDGTPMDPATELAPYELICGDKVTSIPAAGTGEQEFEVTKYQILPAYGDTECFMVAIDTDGLRSTESNRVTITWLQSAPMAPTNLIIIRN